LFHNFSFHKNTVFIITTVSHKINKKTQPEKRLRFLCALMNYSAENSDALT